MQMPWESNPNNLPLDVAVLVEENAASATATIAPKRREEAPDTAAHLVERLTAIRERLFWLQAVWANTLSPDVAWEADRYRQLFCDLAVQLRKCDPIAVDALIVGHEALLLAEALPSKPKLPTSAQHWFELVNEILSQHRRSPQPLPKPEGYVADGLQRFV